MTAQLVVDVILGVLGALLASVILAEIRNPFAVKFINLVFAMAAALFIIVVHGLEFLVARLREFTTWLKRSISGGRPSVSMSDIVGPLVYFVCLIALTASDAYLAILTIPQLVGGTPPNLNPDLLAPVTAVLWVCIFVSLFATMLDLFGVTHFLRAYGSAQGQFLRAMQIASIVAFGMAILTAVLFGYFRRELANPVPQAVGTGGVDAVLLILFFVTVSLALVAAGPSLFEGFAPLLLVLASITNFIAHVLAYVLSVPIELLDRVAGLTVGLYDALAAIGRAFWNYLSQITQGTRGELHEIADPVDRGHITDVFRFPAI